MNKSIRALLMAAFCLVSASAFGLTLNSPGVVGTIEPSAESNNPLDEAGWLQQLLDLPNDVVLEIDGVRYSTRTMPPEYAGDVDGTVFLKDDGVDSYVVPAGWEYVMAKYDGINAGYVVWYLGGMSIELPQYPFELFTDTPEQYEMSHWIAFNPIGVPDGGVTVTLLGASLAALGMILRLRRQG